MKQTNLPMIDYLILEDGESLASSDYGGVSVQRESAVGIVTVRLRADYAAAPKLAKALQAMLQAYKQLMPRIGHIACSDYAIINEAPILARTALRDAGIMRP